ncbi:MAG: hypothetical protein KJZ47_04880 [Gemmatimonadales bacterium]|nr:hypothetical protein [Gemmatimonadales bacterium]
MRRRRDFVALLALSLVGGCGVVRAIGSLVPGPSAEMSEGLRIAERHRVSAISDRRFNHAEYWRALAPSLRSERLRVADVGHSMQGRELRTVTFGTGPVTVLLWSQMHGDESTASMALADIFAWLAAPGSDVLRDRLGERLTVTFLPMLNPDGAERFQRENAAGIDINRDARRLSTPEGQTLKRLQEQLRPQFGFNLHDQNARTRVGRDGKQAGIALLAPAADAERTWGPGPAGGGGDCRKPGIGDRRPGGQVRRRLQSARLRRPDADVGHQHGADRERGTAGRPAEAGAPQAQRGRDHRRAECDCHRGVRPGRPQRLRAAALQHRRGLRPAGARRRPGHSGITPAPRRHRDQLRRPGGTHRRAGARGGRPERGGGDRHGGRDGVVPAPAQ